MMGVTVKFLPAELSRHGAFGSPFSWGAHQSAKLRPDQNKAVKAGRGGHAVYQDRQEALIEALCECAFEDKPDYKKIDRGMHTKHVEKNGFRCEKKPIKLQRTPRQLGS